MTREEWDKYYELSRKHKRYTDEAGRELEEEDNLRRLKDEALLDYVRAQFRLQEHYKNNGLYYQWGEVMNQYITSSEARRVAEHEKQKARWSPVIISVVKPKRKKRK